MDGHNPERISRVKVFTSEATNKYALTWGQRPGQGIFFLPKPSTQTRPYD